VAAQAFMIVQCPVTAGFSWFGSRGRVKTWSDGWQKRAGSWPRSSRNGRRQCACSAHRLRVSGRDLGSVSLNVIEMMQLTGMDHSEA